MKLLVVLVFVLSIPVSFASDAFDATLEAAKKGDSKSRVVIGYSYYFGEHPDGSLVEKDINAAFAWASLAKYQGNPEAQVLMDLVKPDLTDPKAAAQLSVEYFKLYGAKKDKK